MRYARRRKYYRKYYRLNADPAGCHFLIPGGIGNPAGSCSSPQLDSSTQGFGELSSCGGVELSQGDAIKENRYYPEQCDAHATPEMTGRCARGLARAPRRLPHRATLHRLDAPLYPLFHQPPARREPHPDEMNTGSSWEGRALPRAGAWGKQVSPDPCVRAWPSHGRGRRETRFPHPLAEGVWSRETVMRMAHPARCTWPGSAGVPPAPRRRGHGAGPLPDSPPLGAGTRRLPPAGEAGRGAEPGERWSPQPSMRLRRTRTG